MKTLPTPIKEATLAKWSFRAKNMVDADLWFEHCGGKRCAFCYYFTFEPKQCICPLHDSNYHCCIEFEKVMSAVADGDVDNFNAACQAMYDKINALPVGGGRVTTTH